MSKEISEDVLAYAASIFGAYSDRREPDAAAQVVIIARAILAERERCAQIADAHQSEDDFTLKAAQVAAAIRQA